MTAIPKPLNLEAILPDAIRVFKRRVVNTANTAQQYGPNQTLNITLPTATPGAFLDPLDTFLQFDFTITNSNPFIDFYSFGSGGVTNSIRELRWICQGTNIEEMLYYNQTFTLANQMHGSTRKRLEVYKPSCVRQNISEAHSANVIKAPMVNESGNPMWNNALSTFASINGTNSAYYGLYQGQNTCVSTNAPYCSKFVFASGVDAGFTSTSVADSIQALNSIDYWNTKNMANISATTPLLGINGLSSSASINSQTPFPGRALAGFAGSTGNPGSAGNNFNSIQLANQTSTNGNYTTSLYQGMPSMMNVLGSTVMTLPGVNGTSAATSNAAGTPSILNIDTNPANPLNWPFYMPNGAEYRKENWMSLNESRNHFMFLSDVKYAPIGMPGYQRPDIGNDGSIYQDTAYPYNSANFKNVGDYTQGQKQVQTTYNCCLPLLSGVLGSLARKMWPSMLIANNQMSLELRLEDSNVVFQVAMDPCRRVLGTLRDYIVNGGSLGGLFGQGNYNSTATMTGNNATPFFNVLPDSINPAATSQAPITESVQQPGAGWVQPNPNIADIFPNTASSIGMGLGTLDYVTTSMQNGSATTAIAVPEGKPAESVQGISSFQTITGLNKSINSYQPVVGDSSALSLALSGLLFTGERGYAKKVQVPVLGGYSALIGANLAAASILAAQIAFQQENRAVSNFSSLMFLPYNTLACEGASSTVDVVQSDYYSSNDKFSGIIDSTPGPSGNGGNANLYNEGLSTLITLDSASQPASNSAGGNAYSYSTLGNTVSISGNKNLYGGSVWGIPCVSGVSETMGVNFQFTNPGGSAVNYNSNQIVAINGTLTVYVLDPSEFLFNQLAPNASIYALQAGSSQAATCQSNWLSSYDSNDAEVVLNDFDVSLDIINTQTLAVIQNIPLSTINVNAGSSYGQAAFEWNSSGLISSGVISTDTCPNGYSLKLKVIVTATNFSQNPNVGFVITPIDSTALYQLYGTSFNLPGTNIQIGPIENKCLAQTTNYPESNVLYNQSGGAQNPYYPFQIGNVTSNMWTEQAGAANPNNFPYLPCPSLTDNITSSGNNGTGVGRALLTRTEVMVRPSGVPYPQYLLANTPFLLKELKMNYDATTGCITVVGTRPVMASDLISESQGCYGSFLPSSRAQSLRCFFPGGQSGTKGGMTGLTYSIGNVKLVTSEIIVPTELSTALISMSAQGEIAIQSDSVHTYQTAVNNASTQNLNVPAKISSANSLYWRFQPSNYSGDIDSQLYDSMSNLCPYTSIKVPNFSFGPSSQASGPNGFIGTEIPPIIQNFPAKDNSFQIQLRLGNELIPQSPIGSITEIIAELLKSQHILYDTEGKINAMMPPIVNIPGSVGNVPMSVNGTNGGYYFDCLPSDTFCSAFIHPNLLNDQTYIGNKAMGSVASMYNTATSSSITAQYFWGQRNTYTLPVFEPSRCSFVIGLDLETFSGESDICRSGRYLGNNQISLYMTNCTQFENYNQSGIASIQMYSHVFHDVKFSFQAGGTVVAYF